MSRHAQTDPLVFSFMFNRYLLIHLLCSSVYFFHLTLCLQRGWWSAIIYSLISLWISSLLPKTTHKWGLSNKSIFTSLLSSLHVFYFKKKKKKHLHFMRIFKKTHRAVKLTRIYRKLYDWEWVRGEGRKNNKEGEKVWIK